MKRVIIDLTTEDEVGAADLYDMASDLMTRETTKHRINPQMVKIEQCNHHLDPVQPCIVEQLRQTKSELEDSRTPK